ncbi:hypothetical protein CTRI78_v002786 [Colletotrichum trifolii]|uniref:DUF7587 domain-containing protein n=1 Tax=Colletotrichum trifolii TaxID=5466 RepID=A0A4R8RQF6_COLTR|nr:hypothetical protein CTRI78_v002786 [Colletotrichum trifolii]
MDKQANRQTPDVLFRPEQNERALVADLANIPRYLFRVHAPSTRGRTTNNEVTSVAALDEYDYATSDMLSWDFEDAADMLRDHLTSWSREGDNLMSWSSSFLFALHYALYHIARNATDNASNTRIYVVDTMGMAVGSFLPDLGLIDYFVYWDSGAPPSMRLSKLQWLRRSTEYNFGEYLCQGTLSIAGRATSTSLQNLINHGLLGLVPELAEPNGRLELAKRVYSLREDLFSLPSRPTKVETRTALVIAQGCFGQEWALPMMAALLSLRKRVRDGSGIQVMDLYGGQT